MMGSAVRPQTGSMHFKLIESWDFTDSPWKESSLAAFLVQALPYDHSPSVPTATFFQDPCSFEVVLLLEDFR